MSLTSELKRKNSPLRQFYEKCALKEGLAQCLSLLQSTSPPTLPALPYSSALVYASVGITTDYLIRYSANKNKLKFSDTIAGMVFQKYKLKIKKSPKNKSYQWYYHRLSILYKIAKYGLDGREGTDMHAIYGAVALSVLDGIYRGGKLPAIFEDEMMYGFTDDQKIIINTFEGKLLYEKSTRFIFSEYIKYLGGEHYIQDISNIVKKFIDSINNHESELYGTKFIVLNKALTNSILLCGADFDCIIKYGKSLILTDIKTSINKLTTFHIHQLIGYALLHDEKSDGIKINAIGFYHARSGSFRYLPLEIVIPMIFPGLQSVDQAKRIMMKYLSTYTKTSHPLILARSLSNK